MIFFRDIDKQWKFSKVPKNFNSVYCDSLIRYFNALDPLFEKSQKISDFEFITSLLNIEGCQDAGWIAFESTEKIFSFINKLKNKIKDSEERLYLLLLLYGLIIEASLPYDLLANLLNIILGDRYTILNFPDIKTRNSSRPQFPSEKINKLLELAKKANVLESLTPLKEIFNKELRNAVFHSDYIIYKDEIRIPSINKVYKRTEIVNLINKTLAYFETVVKLRESYRLTYDGPKIIKVHPKFNDQNAKPVVMVREGTGAIGIRIDNAHFATLYAYEKKLLDRDPMINLFPKSKIEMANKFIRFIPRPFKRYLIRYFEKRLN